MKKVFFRIILGIVFSGFITAALPQTTIVLQPGPEGYDAYINSAYPDIPQQDGNGIGYLICAWTFYGVPGLGRGLLRFDLSQIPSNVVVTSAKLSLYFEPNCCYGIHYGENAWYISRLTGSWNETTVTWNTQPPATTQGRILVPPTIDPMQDFLDIDVTDMVAEMVANPQTNFGFMFQIQTEEYYRTVTLGSGDNPIPGRRPKLEITYANCPLPDAGFTYAIDHLQASFYDTSSPASSWFWTFGDSTSSAQQNPVHIYTYPGIYQVCLAVTDSCGTSTTCQTVEINCIPPLSGFYYYTSFPEVFFYDTSYTPTFISRLWDFGDSATSTEKDPVHIYNNGTAGVYNACLTIFDSCGTRTSCNIVYYCMPLTAHFSNTNVATNDRLVRFADETAGANSWHWEFGDGESSELQNPVHLYREYGIYNVCLTAGNSIIHNTFCDSVKITATHLPPGLNNAVIFPNPTSGIFYIGWTQNVTHAEMRFSDISGNLIFLREFSDIPAYQPFSIDISTLPKGLYLVEMKFDGYAKTWKLVLE